MSAESLDHNSMQIKRGSGNALPVEDLEDHFPFLHDELDYYKRHLDLRAVLVRTESDELPADDINIFYDIVHTEPSVTDIFLPVENGDQLAGFHVAATKMNWLGNLHAVHMAGSNSLELSLKSGLNMPLPAWAPNELLASQQAIDSLGSGKPYDIALITNAYNAEVQELTQNYGERLANVIPLDLPTLVAVAGMRKQLEHNMLAKRSVIVIASTSHSSAYSQLEALSRRRIHVASGYTSRWPSSSK